MSGGRDPLVHKERGNAAYKQGQFLLAVEHYTKAILYQAHQPDPLLFSNRAQAYIRLKSTPDGHGFALAIDDCSNAIKLDPSIAKLWYRRAVAHKGLGGQTSLRSALEDYAMFLDLIRQSGTAEATTVEAVRVEMVEIELLLIDLQPKPETSGTPSSTFRMPGSSTPQLPLSTIPSKKTMQSSMAFHTALASLWASSGPSIITQWRSIAAPAREAVLAGPFATLTSAKYRAFAEYEISRVQQGDNLLDFIRARATIDPHHSAHRHDLVRSMHVNEQTRVGAPMKTSAQNTQMVSLGDPGYGPIRSGEMMSVALFEATLSRQRECYRAALGVAKLLSQNARPFVDLEGVEEFNASVPNKLYAGREPYSLVRVEEIATTGRAYAEDHVEFLRQDYTYLTELVRHRVPSVLYNSGARDTVVAAEILEITALAYSRKMLWKEMLNVVDRLRASPTPTQADLALLVKLTNSLAIQSHGELAQATKSCFEAESATRNLESAYAAIGDWGVPPLLKCGLGLPVGLVVEINLGISFGNRRLSKSDPLASLCQTLVTGLNPRGIVDRNYDIVCCLDEIKELLVREPAAKRRLSKHLLDTIGDYSEIINLREMLLDSHMPRINTYTTFPSKVFTGLLDLRKSLERAFQAVPNSFWSYMTVPQDEFARDGRPTDPSIAWSDETTYVPRSGVWEKVEEAFDVEEFIDGLLSKKRGGHESRLIIRRASGVKVSTTKGPSREPSKKPLYEDSDSSGRHRPSSGTPSSEEEDSDEQDSDSDAASPPPLAQDFDSDSSSYTAPPPRTVLPRKARRMRKPAPKRRVIPAALEEPSGSRAVKETFATGAVESQEHAGGFGHGVENEGGNGVPMEPSREKIKTKGKDRAVLKDSDDSDNGPESDEGGDKADDQRQADVSDPAPAGWKFGVSQRVYDTFEKYFGTDKGTRRNEVAWIDLLRALASISFHPIRGSGSSWKFRPTGLLRNNESIVIHEPHPGGLQRGRQVIWTGMRLRKTYGMCMDMFEVKEE